MTSTVKSMNNGDTSHLLEEKEMRTREGERERKRRRERERERKRKRERESREKGKITCTLFIKFTDKNNKFRSSSIQFFAYKFCKKYM